MNKSISDELNKLKDLKKEGILTESEFSKLKKSLLADKIDAKPLSASNSSGGLIYYLVSVIITLFLIVDLELGFFASLILLVLVGFITWVVTKITGSPVFRWGFLLTFLFITSIIFALGYQMFSSLNDSSLDNNSSANESSLDTVPAPPELDKQVLISQCYDEAWSSYNERWLSYCRTNGLRVYSDTSGQKTCEIPINQANYFNDQYSKEKELCVSRYK